MINRHKMLNALNVAFDATVDSDYRQRMAACLLDNNGNILAIGHNTKTSYFWMKTKNGYRKDQKGSHCELDAVRCYVNQLTHWAPVRSIEHDIAMINKSLTINEKQEEKFFSYVRSLNIPMIVVARRKGGIFSETRGSSKPCVGCWEFLRRCGIKSVVYYDDDNHFVEEEIK